MININLALVIEDDRHLEVESRHVIEKIDRSKKNRSLRRTAKIIHFSTLEQTRFCYKALWCRQIAQNGSPADRKE